MVRKGSARAFWALVMVFTLLASVGQPVLAAATPEASPVTSAAGIDLDNLDLSVDPADDFYRFANGGWLDRTEIPADSGSYGVFDELRDLTTQQLLGLLEGLVAGGEVREGTDAWRAVQFFSQGMDLDTRNAQGIEPIMPILDEIGALDDLDALHAFQQTAIFSRITGIFSLSVIPDLLDSSVYGVYLSGPYLGLPNRDYYLQDDASNEAVRAAYIETAAQLLVTAGYGDQEAQELAQAVFDFERALAEPTLTREEQQNFSLLYNPMTVAELNAAYPRMDWAGYLAALGLTGVDQVIVTELGYLQALDGIVGGADLATIKAYLTLETIWTFASYLSDEISGIAFAFRGRMLSGVEEREPLDERVLSAVNGWLTDAVGQLYVAEYFSPEAKAEIEELVDALIVAYQARLEANPWMTDATRTAAIEKLGQLRVNVGYPDAWKSYGEVEIGDSYMQTGLSAYQAETRRQLNRAGEPVDRDEWEEGAQVVNAYYNPLANAIFFPAGILQAPFFDAEADAAVNFGGIGMVIGHEITHGFDLQGSQFDGQGNLRNWWSEEDQAAFQALNNAVVEQFSAIEVLPGLHLNGQITVTENVADMGGVQIAYDGLQVYLAENGEPGEIDGFTPEQRFFISYATIWRSKFRDEFLTMLVKTDPHSPGMVRSVLPIRNMNEFHEAFDIGPNDPMYLPPDERVVIW